MWIKIELNERVNDDVILSAAYATQDENSKFKLNMMIEISKFEMN